MYSKLTVCEFSLDRSAEELDGEHALFWSDHFTLIVYHVCTLMPLVSFDIFI